MKCIRQAEPRDASRIAEILIFTKRVQYYHIFQDPEYSFGEMQVVPLAMRYQTEKDLLAKTWVYDDGIIKGVLEAAEGEVKTLYVEPVFQGEGIGSALLQFAVEQRGAKELWALEKNTRAVAFYAAHGFRPTGEWKFEEGTTEHLIKMGKSTL